MTAADVKLDAQSDDELLWLWRRTQTLLRERKVCRSANIVADVAERLVAETLGCALAGRSTRAHDAVAADGSLLPHLPEWLAEFARFGYFTGWRKGEIAALRWQDVDRAAHEVRIRTSKNGEGRSLPLDSNPELVAVIERRWTAREFNRKDGTIGLSEFVFHLDREPVKEFRKTWATACRRAGIGKKHFHDFRRTAARNMVRAGVPHTVAMSITGHKTVSMFNRYNITSQEDRRDALRRTAEHLAAAPRTRNNVVQMKTDRVAG